MPSISLKESMKSESPPLIFLIGFTGLARAGVVPATGTTGHHGGTRSRYQALGVFPFNINATVL